jgi:hypothetical protein
MELEGGKKKAYFRAQKIPSLACNLSQMDSSTFSETFG